MNIKLITVALTLMSEFGLSENSTSLDYEYLLTKPMQIPEESSDCIPNFNHEIETNTLWLYD